MLSKNKSSIFWLTVLMASTALGGCAGLLEDRKINLTNPFSNEPQNDRPVPSSIPTPIPTPSEPVTEFPLPETVPRGMTIAIDGSTSMVQINQALKSAFQRSFKDTTVETDTTSSNLGIQDLLAGRIDIAAISRPLTPSEQQQGLVAIPITSDAIAIVVGSDNPFRRGLTGEQLVSIFQGKMADWSELAGEKAMIEVIDRPESSGTRQMFQELVLNGTSFGNTANFTTLDRDATTPLLRALGRDGIGYATYPQVADQLTVRVVPIDGLTPEAASYPYQRTLSYAYRQPANRAVQVFLGYVTSLQGKQIVKQAQLNLEDRETVQAKPSQNKLANNERQTSPKNQTQEKILSSQTPLRKKQIRGIYLSRYQITNNADERTIRERVRYYHSQGINTIVHGVWGNGCTMYNSEVMEKTLGYKSCPNLFKDEWLNWLIDEAHQQGMEVHAYFEKGIKIDKNSPIFDLAVEQKWLVPGVDRTYSGIEHYVLDVEIPAVAKLFKDILVEFVQKYPNIDAVQWDDYLGYHAELPGKVDRTQKLTNFVRSLIASMKAANPSVSFDICHHNPYWAKRYFAADWEKWGVDRVFIQAYNEKNYAEELNYAQKYAGIAITDGQLSHIKELADNAKISSVLVFPFSGKPEATASSLKNFR